MGSKPSDTAVKSTYNDAAPHPIAARIVIGVTGHRQLGDREAIAEGVRQAIEYIKQMVPPLKYTPVELSVLSPLAEGSDRLVAREILAVPGATLEAVLPMPEAEYMEDFETEESKREFKELLARASSVTALPSDSGRPEVYKQVGLYTLNQCDVLIALWDGAPARGKGGTAEVVQYAQDNGHPLVWVHTAEQGRVTVEPGKGLDTLLFQDLETFNSEYIDELEFNDKFTKHVESLKTTAQEAGLPYDEVKPTFKYLLRHYVRADIPALRYQHRYHRAESLAYTFACLAIGIVTLQIIFFPERPIILVSEVVLMSAILGIFIISQRQRWHNRWIDYRFLAERFRSALFMAVAGLDVAPMKPPRYLSLSYSTADWMVDAFHTVWSSRPPYRAPESFEAGKNFLREAWLEDQIRYHQGTHIRHLRRYQRMTRISYALFGITLLAALLHVVLHSAAVGPDLLGDFMTWIAVVFPAIAASVTAVCTHRDYLRNSKRSNEMVNHLEELRARLLDVSQGERFLDLMREVEETMIHENEDWRIVVRFRPPVMPT